MSKVAVIGPGALGCFFAAQLARCGVETWLIDYQEQRAAMLNKQGIIVETAPQEQSQGACTQQPIITTRIPDSLDFILVLTKAYATASLNLPPATPVLTLQNGLGNPEILAASVGSDWVLAGSTSEAVTWLEIGHVKHVVSGRTVFGSWSGCNTDTPLQLLRHAGFDTTLTSAPGRIIWEKAIVNAGINPLTAVLNMPNGVLLEKEETRELMRDLVVEATRVANAEGYHFDHDMVEETARICEVTRDNISSMLQDLRKGKRTEIDAISGEIVRRAQAADLPAPRTRTIYQLLRTLEFT